MGYVAGRNVSIEYRWIEESYDRLPAMAANLANRMCVALIGYLKTLRLQKDQRIRLCILVRVSGYLTTVMPE